MNLDRNLPIGHLVHRLNRDDSSAALVLHEALLQLALRLSRTKNEERLGIAKSRDHGVVVDVELFCKRPLGRSSAGTWRDS